MTLAYLGKAVAAADVGLGDGAIALGWVCAWVICCNTSPGSFAFCSTAWLLSLTNKVSAFERMPVNSNDPCGEYLI